MARDPASGKQWKVPLRDYITARQEKMMAQDPFMIRALARSVAADLESHGAAGAEVRAEAFATLNGRPLQRLIDPRVNLAGPDRADWIAPLKRPDEPLEGRPTPAVQATSRP
jgi:hypothetical protein